MTRRDLDSPAGFPTGTAGAPAGSPSGSTPVPRSGAVPGAAGAPQPSRAAAPLERRDGQLRPEWFGQTATATDNEPDPRAAEALATRLAALPAPLLREVTHYADYLADRYATSGPPDGC